MEYTGIDVSRWQGSINWALVKSAGVQFAILRCGGSDGSIFTDKFFNYNYSQCKKHNIPVGAYYIVGKHCTDALAGLVDAQNCEKIIQGKQFEYPVIIDFELPGVLTKQGNTDAVNTFCKYLENLGYYAMIYASDISGFKDRLIIKDLQAFDKWVARYGSKPKYAVPYGIWQYSSSGNVPGISGRVDMNISYNNYPAIMRDHHLNGF